MNYESRFVPSQQIPSACNPLFQHIVDTYASEINKTASVWSQFSDANLPWKPHPKSSTVQEIMQHQLLSERRFFAEFLGSLEPDAEDILPGQATSSSFLEKFVQLATARLEWLASLNQDDWTRRRQFFDAERERIWIFWRRVLHTAHHRTQLSVYIRLLEKPVPATYGPTADVTWAGADPTISLEAAKRA